MVSRRRRLVVYEEATSDSEEAPAPPKKPCQWLQSELATLANEHEKGATMSLLDRVYTPTMVIPAVCEETVSISGSSCSTRPPEASLITTEMAGFCF